jgi:dTDP-4-amino-4,6-dideoxygalactose transaminase/acetyltransferase-like isoleucine patch superfamily enzyme
MTRRVTETKGSCVLKDVWLGEDVLYWNFVNLYGCTIGDGTKIGTFVEIQKGASVGARCKISSHSFICEGVTIQDDVFIGHGVRFINDLYPRATRADGELATEADWTVVATDVGKGASVGTGAVILGGVRIGEGALVGAGAVVTHDVPARMVVAGNPARVLRAIDDNETDAPVTQVPPFNLSRQTQQLKPQLLSALERVVDSCAFSLGEEVSAFERELGETVGGSEVIGVNSGTSALHLALKAHGVGPGDEVITTALTFVATAWAISYCGATPIFVDVDPGTLCIDPGAVAAALASHTSVKAVIAVHLYGQPADLAPLVTLCKEAGVTLIEDAAQAIGATYEGRPIGTFGDAACFSFYPSKNLGAAGDAGCVMTRDSATAAAIRSLRDHAQVEKYLHDRVGYNYRMSGFQAAVLRVKLGHVAGWNARRQEIARAYLAGLTGLEDLTLPVQARNREHVWHQFVVRHPRRDEIREALSAAGVGTGLHYPRAVHQQPAYADLAQDAGCLPVAEAAAGEVFSLPMFPELTDSEVEFVVKAVRDVLTH